MGETHSRDLLEELGTKDFHRTNLQDYISRRLMTKLVAVVRNAADDVWASLVHTS